MISLKFNILIAIFLANLVLVNLVELNTIFSVSPNEKVCDRKNKPFQRHTIINNLDKALEIGLNKSFHDKFECLEQIFDDKLIEMQQFYKLKLKQQAELNKDSTNSSKSSSNKHDKKKDKQNKQKQAINGEFMGQTGFIFYSLNQNATITDFKHESFKFVQPVSNQTELTTLENEIEAFNSDIIVLKSIMNNIKKNIKSRANLLKAIKSNERELDMEQKKSLLEASSEVAPESLSNEEDSKKKDSNKKNKKNVDGLAKKEKKDKKIKRSTDSPSQKVNKKKKDLKDKKDKKSKRDVSSKKSKKNNSSKKNKKDTDKNIRRK